MARFLVAPEVFAMFPDAVLGVIVARGIDNTSQSAEIPAGLRREEARVRELFAGQPVTEHPHIAAWREAYRKFGAKPKDHPSSIENLVRRVAKGHALPRINPLVDLYNTVSLRFLVPAGGEDLDRTQGRRPAHRGRRGRSAGASPGRARGAAALSRRGHL
ncbi:MAG: hypothetical protein QOF89_2879 [Acidobacteriota bacterium]|jgi:DNA/RNA-binding domain of Phe-tRNA-synthetase-like protein|nr:hypothetical protein [Acidobacteriota bacterium]